MESFLREFPTDNHCHSSPIGSFRRSRHNNRSKTFRRVQKILPSIHHPILLPSIQSDPPIPWTGSFHNCVKNEGFSLGKVKGNFIKSFDFCQWNPSKSELAECDEFSNFEIYTNFWKFSEFWQFWRIFKKFRFLKSFQNWKK